MRYLELSNSEMENGVVEGQEPGGDAELWFHRRKVSVLQDEESSGDCLHNSMNIHSPTELCT